MFAEPKVTIYTDGACSGNPGPGGWGALLRFNGATKELMGHELHTTNNRMEMMAAIEGLRALTKACIVEIYTDSKYLQEGVTKWIHTWVARNWRTSGNKPVKNLDLWKILYHESAKHTIKWHWVKGHADNEGNIVADRLAVAAKDDAVSLLADSSFVPVSAR